jgi:hypothetical protein
MGEKTKEQIRLEREAKKALAQKEWEEARPGRIKSIIQLAIEMGCDVEISLLDTGGLHYRIYHNQLKYDTSCWFPYEGATESQVQEAEWHLERVKDAKEEERARQAALKKLTPEEQRLLGLKD